MAGPEWRPEHAREPHTAVAARLIFAAQAKKSEVAPNEESHTEYRAIVAEAMAAHALAVQEARQARGISINNYQTEAARAFLILNCPIMEPYASRLAQLYAQGARGDQIRDDADDLAGAGWAIDAYSDWLELPVDDDGGRDQSMVQMTIEALQNMSPTSG